MAYLSEVGEFGLIEKIKRAIRTDSSVIKGIGDDCAVLKFNQKEYLLATSDMIVEGVDFTLGDDPYLVGRKALAVSLSDIASCAGLPRYALLSLGAPRRTSLARIDKIFQGLKHLARAYKVNIIGGDISKASQIVLDVTVLGLVEKGCLVLRSSALPGDIIFVSGSLGGSISGRHLMFSPRIKEARFLVKNFKVNAMIDISDGLGQDLGHILTESSAGAVIYESLIPLSKEAAGMKDALYGGEDFELLFTMPAQEAKRLLADRHYNFKPIGEITEKGYGLRLIDKKGKERIIAPKGFRHF